MYDKSRLHPISIFYGIIRRLKELIFPFIGIILVGGSPSEWELLTIIIVSVILLALVIGGGLSWYYFSYYVAERELRIEYGVFVKKKRYIPFERIQSMDYTEGLLHRPFRLVKVKIETAGGAGEAEAELAAISRIQAEDLKEFITNNKYSDSTAFEEDTPKKSSEKELVYQITNGQLMALAATSGGIGVIISAIIAFVSQFENLIPYKLIFSHVRQFVSSGIAFISLVIFLIVFFLWICSLLITVLKFANFTLSRSEKDIIITRGLLEKKQITIPIDRIQAIKITENPLRQPFKLASLYIISAGGSLTDMEAATVLAIPIMRKKNIAEICKKIVPDYEMNETITSPPRRALWRYLIKCSWFAIPISTILIFYFHLWGLLSLLLLIILPVWGYMKFRSAGYYLSNKQLTLCYRQIDQSTIVMKRNRVQVLYYTEGPWQKKGNFGSIHGVVASGVGGATGVVTDLSIEDVHKIYDWYSTK